MSLKYCSYYVSEPEAWADKIFKRFVNLRADYQKLQHQRDPSHPLTACQQWKLTDLSYLKTFYKQGYKASRRATSRTSTEHSSDEEADDRGHESSASSRRETPTKIPVPHVPTPTRRCKKRRDEKTDSEKDETASKLSEIMGVMKDSAHHLVARSQNLSQDSLHQERVSFFQWMLEFTSRMPRNNWRDFQKQAFSLAFAYTPADSPQAPQARPRISQVASTSSSQADHAQLHGQQYPMHPPARPAPPTGGGVLEMLQSQPTEMVSNFLLCSLLYGHFYMVIYIWSFCYVCKVSVINIIKFIRESVLLKQR